MPRRRNGRCDGNHQLAPAESGIFQRTGDQLRSHLCLAAEESHVSHGNQRARLPRTGVTAPRRTIRNNSSEMLTAARILVIAILMLAPLPFGAVQPWAWG